MKRIVYIIAAATVALTGCNKQGGEPTSGSGDEVRFTASIGGTIAPAGSSAMSAQAKTRTSGDGWAANDAIGIFMNKAEIPFDFNNIGMGRWNRKFTTPDGTSFGPATADDKLYFPVGAVDFVAYYPYGDMGNDPGQLHSYNYNSLSVADQSNPAAIDLLYSDNATNKQKSDGAVSLTFRHVMTKVVIHLKQGTEGGGDYSNATVDMNGMPLYAQLSLDNGRTNPSLDFPQKGTISMRKIATQAGMQASFEAIVVPQASNLTGRSLSIVVPGAGAYTWPVPDTRDLPQGKVVAYTLTVNGQTIAVDPTTVISDWTTNDRGDTGKTIPMQITKKGVEMVLIEAGSFMMGSPATELDRSENETETQHKVTLTKDFYMGRYEVTNAQYAAFLNAKHAEGVLAYGYVDMYDYFAYFIDKPREGLVRDFRKIDQRAKGVVHNDDGSWSPVAGYENFPVIWVTWDGAKAFADWIGASLPTEAQWEYACRGDYPNKATETATKPFGIGDGTKLYGDIANIYGHRPYDLSKGGDISNYTGTNPPATYLATTSAVGSYIPNNYGLYDMHGNVWEWCSDWHGGIYDSSAVTDPTGPATGYSHVMRGGCWVRGGQEARSAYRYEYNVTDAGYDIGFRVVFNP